MLPRMEAAGETSALPGPIDQGAFAPVPLMQGLSRPATYDRRSVCGFRYPSVCSDDF
jgi:hypothetical protein